MVKKICISFLAIFGLLLSSATIFYGLYLTPKKRAATHLEYVHQAIDEVHPGILLNNGTEFRGWNKDGYAATLQLLPEVKTRHDLSALIRFYFSGYQDSHLWGDVGKTLFSAIESQDSLWAGWLLRATENSYLVDVAKQGDNYPPKDAELLSCDNKAIDELLREHFAPYFDRRWHILRARQQSARALTLISDSFSVLNRPPIHQCIFRIAGNEKSYPLVWQAIDKKDTDTIQTALKPPYKLPGLKVLSDGALWITASDFQLNSPEAASSQKKLLDDLEKFSEKSLVVFDTRLNSGGSSRHGFNILSRALNNSEKHYVSHKWDEKNEGADAQFRASWRLYWNYEYELKEVITNQGSESQTAKFLIAAMEKIKSTLDEGQSYFYQSEIFDDTESSDKNESAPPAKWDSTAKIILLTSSRCSSACLDFVDMVKLIPNFLHLGEPTNADTSYIEVARLQSSYYGETVNFAVPAKKWNKRMRKDNEPYNPDIIYNGNIYDDQAVEKWVLEQAEQHFKQR